MHSRNENVKHNFFFGETYIINITKKLLTDQKKTKNKKLKTAISTLFNAKSRKHLKKKSK